ncbi:hypothetical protein ACF1AB_41070, partial [Streptomyces sp. NPDC014846]
MRARRPCKRRASVYFDLGRGNEMALVSTATVHAQGSELPEVVDPSRVAPKDARELSRLFFGRLAVLEEGTAEFQYARNTLIEM